MAVNALLLSKLGHYPTVHGMDYLLTWNCKHIANAEMQSKVAMVCRESGFEPPVICTPEELSGG
jgi:hypothetical protein